MKNPFTGCWSAKGSNLCLGEWGGCYLDKPLTLQPDQRESDMGTYGIYSFIDPDDEGMAEGLLEDDWILDNADWLTELFAAHDIPIDEQHMRWFYQLVNPHDWRCGSCGGCI